MAEEIRSEGTGNVTRRGFLGMAGGAAVLALAGCAAGEQPASGSSVVPGSAPAAGSTAADGSAVATPVATTSEPTVGSEAAMATEDIDPALLVGTAEDPDATLITAVAPNDPYGTGRHHATIEVEGYGTMELVLDADSAPISVSNFCRLAELGFYDGLTFFRIIPGFMIQGGDPFGNGTGGATWNIKGEFRSNGVNNKLLHTRGVISMARADDNDSASSQFFIMHAANHQLDGNYAAFGHVTSGIEVVDGICDDVTNPDENGMVAAAYQPKITKVTIVD